MTHLLAIRESLDPSGLWAQLDGKDLSLADTTRLLLRLQGIPDHLPEGETVRIFVTVGEWPKMEGRVE